MSANVASTPSTPFRTRWRGAWLVLLGLVFLGVWAYGMAARTTQTPEVPYTTAYAWIREGKVSEVTIKGDVVSGMLREPETLRGREGRAFVTRAPDDQNLVPLLRDKGVVMRVDSPEPPLVLQILTWLFPWILILGVWWWLSRRAETFMASRGPFGAFLRRGKRFENSRADGVTFDSVAGLGGAKRDLQEIVEFLREPDRAKRVGARVPRGILLVGPPGTGKTLLARAVAGEAKVPFYTISASEFMEMFVGVGAARVRELFQEAKANAPAIVFIDEIDAVGRARGAGFGIGHDEREQTLNQLLAEMDGFDRDERVIVLAATNRPDVLDPALLRPGRFDRRVLVDLPERGARRAILGVHTAGKPLASDVDLERLAEQTVGFSGADLANLANEAALAAVRRRSGHITRQDFADAYDKIVLGDPREGKLGGEEKRRVAVHEAGHALVSWMTPNAAPARRVSILPRGMALGATHQLPAEERHLHTCAELAARLQVLLGGFAAEDLVLDDVSTGAENDLREATRIATRMVAHYGMSDVIGPVYVEHEAQHPFLGHRVATGGGASDATVFRIENEVRLLLREMLANARATIRQHREELECLVEALLARETLEHSDLCELLGEPVAARVAAPVDSANWRLHAV